MKPLIGLFRRSFTGELPFGVLKGAFEREHPGGEREVPGHVLLVEKLHQVPPRAVLRDGHLGNHRTRQGFQRGVHPYLFSPDGVAHLLLPVGVTKPGPFLDELLGFTAQTAPVSIVHFIHLAAGNRITVRFRKDCLPGVLKRVTGLGGGCFFLRPVMITLDSVRYLRQVGAVLPVKPGEILVSLRGQQCEGLFVHRKINSRFGDAGENVGEKRVDTLVVELAGIGGVHGDIELEQRPLLAGIDLDPPVLDPVEDHLSKSIFRPGFIALVDDDGIGQIQHVDLVQLGRGPILAGHDVDGVVADFRHAGGTLPDTAGLHDDDVESGGLEHVYRIRKRRAELRIALAGGKAPHVDPLVTQTVHANPVPQERSTGGGLRGVYRQYSHRHVR